MIGEWGVAFTLTTPTGDLDLNATDPTSGWRFQLDPAACTAELPARSTGDDIPQGDGAIPHRRWRGGYVVHLKIHLLTGQPEDAKAACDADLVGMLDLLGLHLNEMIRTGLVPGAPNSRLSFSPSGQTDRMFDKLQLLTAPRVGLEGGVTTVEFEADTAFPYYIEAAETQTQIGTGGAGGTVTVNNPGNTDYYPAIRVQGPVSSFDIINHDVVDLDGVVLQLTYDSSLPGAAAIAGGSYLEIDFFRQTAYLNGNQANYKGGIDFLVSDFFPIAPGDNDIELVGGDALVLHNGAWA